MTLPKRRAFAPVQGGSLRAGEPASPRDDLELALAYHERTKHRVSAYARGPEALDWSSQPDPFRRFEGAPTIPLPIGADALETPFAALYEPHSVAPQPPSLASIGLLFELSLALSAWKSYGPDRWAVRCNPSSGNLHPTEGYLVCRGMPQLKDGVYHYLSRDHSLELRARLGPERPDLTPGLLIGLSSVHWREAWKYGERAFRYCQLDVGHALGALRYAAAALGWRLELLETVSSTDIAHYLGLDRREDFGHAEPEEAEVLLEVIVDPSSPRRRPLPSDVDGATWYGTANLLDPHPMYYWPVIDEVAEATRSTAGPGDSAANEAYPLPCVSPGAVPAATVIRQRRSAQRFDAGRTLPRGDFYALLDALLPRPVPPWDLWSFSARLHPVLLVHRVEDLEPGLYALLRHPRATDGLRSALRPEFTWNRPSGCPEHLPLFQLAAANCGAIAKTIHCHQPIAADSCFALGMLAEYDTVLQAAPWRYRQLHWEAGLLGQALYLEAEVRGLRGTGIGCYFDDSFHELLGLTGQAYQSLYHFTVGYPVTDTRIVSAPPYAERP